MNYEYENGLRDKTQITKKANETLRKIGIEKFKTNPTTRIEKRGYRLIYVPGRKWVKEHHYIWEQKNGKLPSGKIIHHINFNPLDNRIENMTIMDKKEHTKLHYAKRTIDAYGQFVSKELTL